MPRYIWFLLILSESVTLPRPDLVLRTGPKMFYQEPLPPHNKVVVISDEEMDTTFNFFKE
jgi:hypothetical protein